MSDAFRANLDPGGAFRAGVGILGAGRWGTTLAWLAAQDPQNRETEAGQPQGREVHLWSDEPAARARSTAAAAPVHAGGLTLGPTVHLDSDLRTMARRCHLLVVAVPVARLRPLLRQLGEVVDGSHVLVHAVRGIEVGTGALPSRVVAEETCVRKVGALLGAALVDELAQGRPNAALVASRFAEVIAVTKAAFAGGALRLSGSADLVGVEAAAAAASAVAVALGMAIERGFGPAALAAATARGAAEVARLAAAHGGEAQTGWGIAGLGSLLVECRLVAADAELSHGRDVELGRRLARLGGDGKPGTEAAVVAALGPVDATQAARAFARLAADRAVAAPIVTAVAAVLDGRVGVDAVERALLA